jgi:hypothetical protein
MNDEKKSDGEQPSEEFVKFEAAMRKIVTVDKESIVHKLPKMFRERVADARKSKKRPRHTKP